VHFLTELGATNVLETLSLGQVPLCHRNVQIMILCHSWWTCHKQPVFLEPFLDAVFIGEADDVIDELVRFLAKAKQQCADRRNVV